MIERAGLAALLLVVSASAGMAATADPVAGRHIADRWCSSCHVVAGRGGTDATPTLESIAKDPRRGPDWVRGWLNDPHPPMPNLTLTRAEIDDVVAYLEGLSR